MTFLALLELIRQRVARAIQEQPFSEIVVAVRPTEEHQQQLSGSQRGE